MGELRPPRYTEQNNGYLIHSDNTQSISYGNFRYTHLSSSRSIRLLRYSPNNDILLRKNGQATILIHLTVEEHPLNERGLNYKALSYCWGNTKDRVPIVLGSGAGWSVQLITPNAWAAINALKGPELLWMDQICINQNDDREKEIQIPLMKDIYSRCQSCAVWLGIEDSQADSALAFINRLSQSLHIGLSFPADSDTWLNLSHNEIRRKLRVHLGRDHLPPENDPGWAALARCLCNTWFTRVWTFQEALLPGFDSVEFYAGQSRTTLRKLSRASRLLGTWNIAGIRYTFGRDQLFHMSKLHYRLEHKLPRSLFVLLLNTSERQCLMARDHIYALFGLQMEETYMDPIAVDISKPDHKLFTEVTLKMIKSSSSLLVCTTAMRQGGLVKNLPSWVTDWTAPSNAPLLEKVDYPFHFSADGGRRRPLTVDFNSSRAELTVRGKRVDTVIKVVERDLPENPQVSDLIAHFRSLFPRLLQLVTEQKTIDHISLVVQISKTATADNFLAAVHGHSELKWGDPKVISRLRRLFEPSSGTQTRTEDTEWLQDYVVQAANSKLRRFALLEKFNIGLVPQRSRSGDIVVILRGLSLPVILRPHGPTTYQLVGSCYVDRIMHGEHCIRAGEEREFRLI